MRTATVLHSDQHLKHTHTHIDTHIHIDFGILKDIVVFHKVLICISLLTNNAEHPFLCLFAIHIIGPSNPWVPHSWIQSIMDQVVLLRNINMSGSIQLKSLMFKGQLNFYPRYF